MGKQEIYVSEMMRVTERRAALNASLWFSIVSVCTRMSLVVVLPSVNCGKRNERYPRDFSFCLDRSSSILSNRARLGK